MLIHISGEALDYDGSQLSSHFAFRTFGLQGDSLVCFQGGMNIPAENVADLADLMQKAAIRGSHLLHIIVEHFAVSLETAVLRQRMLVRLAAELINRSAGQTVRVEGDDLYVTGGKAAGKAAGKLSVSIAAPSPVSCLIHLGINISTKDVPVRAASLDELGVDAGVLAADIAQAYKDELASIRLALSKVRAVP